MANDVKFFDAGSFSRAGDTRRDTLTDTLRWLDDEAASLQAAIDGNDLARARQHFEEIKGWVDALDDDLCERDEDGNRID